MSVCAPVLAGAAAFGQTTTYNAAAGNHAWGTSANWSNGLPTAAGIAVFNNLAYSSSTTAPGSVDLGGVTRAIDTLQFDNSSNLPASPNYTLSNGTLSLNHLIVTGSLQQGNVIAANVVAAASALSADVRTSATTSIDGSVSASSLNLIHSGFAFGQGTLQLSNSANQFSTISIGNSTTLVGEVPGALGAATITIATDGVLSVFTNGAVSTYGNNVHAGLGASIDTDIPPTVLNSPGTSKFGALIMDPDAYVFMRGFDTTSQSFTSTTLNGDNMFYPSFLFNPAASGTDTLGVADLGAVHQATANSSLTNNGPGTLRISAVGDYTGGTIASGGVIDAAADGALGHGLVQIQENAALKLAHQSAANFNPVNIDSFGAMGGDLSGAHYSGAARNVTAAPSTIFYSVTPGTAPVRGVDVSTPAYLAGITNNAQSIIVGDNPASIYYGVAFGLYSPGGTFAGSISESAPGQGISVYTTTGFENVGAATFNTVAGPAGAGGVNFFGPGEIRMNTATLGSAGVYNVTGSPDNITDTNFLLTLTGVSTLAAGRTVNISNGVFQTGDGRSLATGSTVNVLNTGSYYLNDFATNSVASPQQGTINIQTGGALYVVKQSATPAAGATFNYSPGSLLILANPLNTGSPTWISPNSDVIVESSGAFTGSGIVLGNGRRLTTPAYNITLSGGAGVSAAPGATKVLITATTDGGIEIDDAVNLPGVDLQIGDANPFHGVDAYTARDLVGQDGQVALNGPITTRNLSVAGGDLIVGSSLQANNFSHNSTGTTTLLGGANLTGTFNVSAGNVADFATLQYGAASNTTVTGGALNFQNSAKPALPANPLTVTIAAAGAVSATGAADPFSDNAGHRMAIANNGALAIGTTSNISTLTGAGTTTVNSAASLAADSIRQSALNLNNSATVTVRPTGHTPGASTPTINVVNNLSLAPGAKLGLSDGDLIVKYTGTSPLGAIAAALASGYNTGHWNGPGIASSSASTDPAARTALGYIDNVDIGYTTFNGEPVDTHTILVKYTYYGDNTLDGKVDLGNDFNLFLQGYLRHASGWDFGDYNYDGVVNNADFQLFVNGFAGQGGSLGALDQVIESTPLLTVAQKASLFAVVPEPTAPTALAAIAIFSAARRRRRRGLVE
jgi:hypothetical protein